MGNTASMRRMQRYGWFHAVLAVCAWRTLSEVLGRRRLLLESGVLERRLEDRRARRVDRALESVGSGSGRERVFAAVHVGPTPARDVDDVALLEGSMRRAARRHGVARACSLATPGTTRPATDWGELLEEAREPARSRARGIGAHGEPIGDRAPAWAVASAVVAAGLTLVALVRPLEPAAPWLAAAGVALALAGWVAARRH